MHIKKAIYKNEADQVDLATLVFEWHLSANVLSRHARHGRAATNPLVSNLQDATFSVLLSTWSPSCERIVGCSQLFSIFPSQN